MVDLCYKIDFLNVIVFRSVLFIRSVLCKGLFVRICYWLEVGARVYVSLFYPIVIRSVLELDLYVRNCC